MAVSHPMSITIAIPTVLLFWATFTSIMPSGDAIMCWDCNSHYDKNCADPFRNRTFELTDCSMKDLDHFPDKKASACRKIIQKVKDDYRVVRGCGWLESEKESTDCIKRAGTFNVLVQYCSCDHDGCNGARSIMASSMGWMISIILPSMMTVLASITVK